jgi:hypothetical protein
VHWSTSWLIVKDVALTGTGLALIVTQAFAGQPQDQLLVAGLALTGVGASFHIGKLVSGRIDGRGSSSPSQPEPARTGPPSSPPEVTDD